MSFWQRMSHFAPFLESHFLYLRRNNSVAIYGLYVAHFLHITTVDSGTEKLAILPYLC